MYRGYCALALELSSENLVKLERGKYGGRTSGDQLQFHKLQFQAKRQEGTGACMSFDWRAAQGNEGVPLTV